ncbi:MAG TPA: hypothetical protein EYO97_05615 [Gemmatimonadetes bacterium]|nr:hypothetical protein [Gemmatimonadota bacterium]
MPKFDWDDKKSWLHSMELFANELMPALNLRAGELPDDSAFWTEDPDGGGSGDSPPGVEA